MTRKEKRLLGIAVGIFVLYAALELLPSLWDWSHKQWQDLENIQMQIDSAERLGRQNEVWQQRHAEIMQQRDVVEKSLLIGNTYELIAARLQAISTELAKSSSMSIKSHELAEFTETGDWVLVTQTLRFSADAGQLMDFISQLNAHPTRLIIVGLDVRVVNTNLEGSITITGFSHSRAESEDSGA